MQRIFLLFCLMAVCISPANGADRLDPQALAMAKAATAYILTENGSGSGFLVKTNDTTGWVVTNAHVVALATRSGGKVTAVFDSGSGQERNLPAKVVALDEDRDLAILAVEDKLMPTPLSLQGKTKVEETMSIWAIGFPFGGSLSIGNNFPAPTISQTQVSSVRSDKLGNIETIQTTGGINQGNSGGPIINGRGGVIAVAVAKIRGAEIGFGIPAAVVEDTLAGRIVRTDPVMRELANNEVEITISATCVDPLANITRVVALVTPTARVSSALKTDAKGRITAPIVTGMTEVQLTYKDQVAKGTMKMKFGKNEQHEAVIQFRFRRKDGTTLFTNDLRCRAGGAVAPPAPNALPDIPDKAVVEFTYTPPKVELVNPPPETFVTGTTERDASGRSRTVLTASGSIVDFGKNVMGIAVHPSGKEVYAIRENEPTIYVYDPLSWKIVTEIPVPEFPISIWADSTLIGVACDKSRVVALVDIAKRSVTASGTRPALSKYTPDTVIGRAPDGSVMSLWEGANYNTRALVHTSSKGDTQILIKGPVIYWATWLPNGTGIISQFLLYGGSPAGRIYLDFPNGGRDDLTQNRLLDGFHITTGRALLTADRKAIVWNREKFKKRWDDTKDGFGPWTYLLTPSLNAVIRDFPGSTITELPDQRLFISIGQIKNPKGYFCQTECYYVDSLDGRVIRRIILEYNGKNGDPFFSMGPINDAVFVPGHELLLIPNRRTGLIIRSEKTNYMVFRCGPIANAIQPLTRSGEVNDPPFTAIAGESIKYTPSATIGVTDFRMRRPLPGMAIDPKTGEWTWTPGKEHVGRWNIVILATVANAEVTVINWTIEVK